MTSCREKLRYASCVETCLCQTESGAQTGAASTNDNGVIFMVLIPLTVKGVVDSVRIGGDTYDDGVFVADKRRGLLGP